MEWSSYLDFVGGMVNVGGNSAGAMADRCTSGLKTFHAWNNMLTFRKIPLHRRLCLLGAAVVSSLSWLCETWTVDCRSLQGQKSG